MTYNVHIMTYLCYVFDTALFCKEFQGRNAAPCLDQTGCHVAEAAIFYSIWEQLRSDQAFQYAYRQRHPLLQFPPLKLVEWIANILAE